MAAFQVGLAIDWRIRDDSQNRFYRLDCVRALPAKDLNSDRTAQHVAGDVPRDGVNGQGDKGR